MDDSATAIVKIKLSAAERKIIATVIDRIRLSSGHDLVQTTEKYLGFGQIRPLSRVTILDLELAVE